MTQPRSDSILVNRRTLADRAYWLERLPAAGRTVVPRPNFQRPTGFSGRHGIAVVPISDSLCERLTALTGDDLFLVYAAFMTALKATLRRYGAADPIVVGSPARRQPQDGQASPNVVTIVDRLDGCSTFREALEQVRATLVEAYRHQELPYDQLVTELRTENDAGLGADRPANRCALFDVLLTLPDLHTPPLELRNDLSITLHWKKGENGKEGEASGGGKVGEEGRLGAAIAYNTDLYADATMQRFGRHLVRMLDSGLAAPDTALEALQMLSRAERHEILVTWNDTASDDDAPFVHERFEAQARRTPGAVAVMHAVQEAGGTQEAHGRQAAGGGGALSFRQLDGLANQLAHRLQEAGVGPEVRVGVLYGRSRELMIALLGVLKAGGAYVPLDASLPDERLRYLLQDAGVHVVVTDAATPPNASLDDHTVIVLEADHAACRGYPETAPARSVHGTNLAYVIYTSGSTGRPKGVMISHGALANYLAWCVKTYAASGPGGASLAGGAGPDGAAGAGLAVGAPLHGSIGFDLTVTTLFLPLLCGRPVVLMPGARGVETLASSLRAGRAFAFLKLTPSHLVVLSETARSAGGGAALPDAGLMIVGGEPLRAEHIAPWQARSSGLRIVNEYGPTEATVGCAAFEIPASSAMEGTIPIGRPIDNAELYVMDGRLEPVPVGVPGDLYVGGAGLARGYLGDPALTAACFIPHPHAETPGARLYRTGDRARLLDTGDLEFLGRADRQVKVRGVRVEPAEIESVLARHPAVREAFVAAGPEPDARTSLTAYFVPAGTPPSMQELRRFLEAKLPDYMVPAAYVALEAMPVTSAGKIDPGALPQPISGEKPTAPRARAPRTGVEAQLAEIWAGVLGVPEIGIDDNFFELGGDSILSIQIIAKARSLGMQVGLSQIFDHPTIAELVEIVAPARQPEAEQGTIEGPVPLTPIQHWFFEQDLRNPHHYNQSVTLDLLQPVDAVRLEQAVRAVVTHHDALRLRFVRQRAGWRATNAPSESASVFARLDLGHVAPGEQAAAMRAAAAELHRSLNLEEGPLLRALLFDLGEDVPARMLLTVHHLAVDSVSWRILLEDLQTAYLQLRCGEPVRLPPKTTSFKRWAEHLTDFATYSARASASAEASVAHAAGEAAYWRGVLAHRAEKLPLDVPAGGDANTVGATDVVGTRFSVAQTQALLQEVPRTRKATIQEVLTAAAAAAVHRWTGRSVRLHLEGHGREDLIEDADLSRTVGWFTSLFPLVIDFGETVEQCGEATFDHTDSAAALSTVKEALRSVPRRGIGYGILRYLCPGDVPEIPAAWEPEISFNYLGQLDPEPSEHAGFRIREHPDDMQRSPEAHRPHLLEIDAIVVHGALQVRWTYGTGCHRRATIERLARDAERFVEALLEDPGSETQAAYSPSDFSASELDRAGLDAVLKHVNRLHEDS